jgi:hypothetical protein
MIHTTRLRECAKAIADVRAQEAFEEDNTTASIRALLERLSDEDQCILTSREAVNVFQAEDGLSWVEHQGHSRRLLQALGFRSDSHRVPGGKYLTGYKITRRALDDLSARYLPPKRPSETPQTPHRNDINRLDQIFDPPQDGPVAGA